MAWLNLGFKSPWLHSVRAFEPDPEVIYATATNHCTFPPIRSLT